MASDFPFGDTLDEIRVGRARELSDLKSKVAVFHDDPFGIASKTAILFAYAHWEGFYNECVGFLLENLTKMEIRVAVCSRLMMVGCIEADLQSMVDRNHTYDAKIDFLIAMREKEDAKFESFDAKCLLARSNLDFAKLQSNFRIMDCNIKPFQILRNRLDKELVAWRHSIAHGSSPELQSFNLDRHLDLASDLLLTLSGSFQEKMLAIQIAALG